MHKNFTMNLRAAFSKCWDFSRLMLVFFSSSSSAFVLMCDNVFPSQKLSVQVQESLAKANDVATETFSSMKTVRSFANEDGETERYKKCLEGTYALNKVEAAAYAASTWTNSVSFVGILHIFPNLFYAFCAQH